MPRHLNNIAWRAASAGAALAACASAGTPDLAETSAPALNIAPAAITLEAPSHPTVLGARAIPAVVLAMGAQPEPGKTTIGPDESFWVGWKRRIDAGLNGTSGNSEGFNIRGLIGAKRLSENMETQADVGYIFSNSEGEKVKSRGEGNIRNDWFFKDSRWGFFATGKLEYDEFQRWQWRASGFVGPSYTFIKDDTTVLRGRVGLGGSYEFGKDAEEEFVPELDIGVDFSHKLTERTLFYFSADWYPSLSDFPEYRAVAKAGLDILVDPESNMNLKLGVADRYNSNPGQGFKKNDFEYFMTIGWEF